MRKKNDKKEVLNKSFNVIKKIWDSGSKSKEAKNKKRNSKPKGIVMKRLGMITFWLLFSFMFLVVIVNAFGTSNSETKAVDTTNQNLMQSPKAIEFSKDFLQQYFTWTNDRFAKERRVHNLSPYFLEGIDELGGILDDDQWASSIDKRDIILKEIEDINENQARYIFKVKFTFRSPTDEKDTGKLKNPTFDELMQHERKMKVQNGHKVKVSEKYISVPVYFDEVSNRYAVYELPSFTYINDRKLENTIKNERRELIELKDSYVENNLVAFLNTFFESYTKDGRDKLNYILEDEKHQDGLNGTMEFSKINNVEIYASNEEMDKFVIDAEVVLNDPSTKFEFKNSFSLVVKRKEQRYVVESLNDERAVNEIISKYTNEQEVESVVTEPEDEKEKDFDYQGELEVEENIDE